MKNIIIAILVALLVAVPATAFATKALVRDPTDEVDYRFDDPDFQVKCWYESKGYGGGLSCLPWSEVKER